MANHHLLEHLATGDRGQAFAAAKTLPHLPRVPMKRIVEVLQDAAGVHNREAAAYALAGTHGTTALGALLACANNTHEAMSVRAHALEGVASHGATARHQLWCTVEATVLSALTDPSIELRFWACYTAGILHMRAAIPYLQALVEGDQEMYIGWWQVAEEATDALAWIEGRATPDRERIPMGAGDGSASQA